MQTRIAVIVTLALVGVVAAVIAVRLARAVARRLARYLDTVESFAAAVAGCPPPAPIGAGRHRAARRGPFVRLPGWRRRHIVYDNVRARLQARPPDPGSRQRVRSRSPAPARRRSALPPAGSAARPRSLGGAARPSGAGRRRPGRHPAAHHVRGAAAPVPGRLVQGAVRRGARPRLPVALASRAAAALPHRLHHALVLRGRAGREGVPEDPRRREGPGLAGRQARLGRALRGHPRRGAPPRSQRHGHPQVLPPGLDRRAATGS